MNIFSLNPGFCISTATITEPIGRRTCPWFRKVFWNLWLNLTGTRLNTYLMYYVFTTVWHDCLTSLFDTSVSYKCFDTTVWHDLLTQLFDTTFWYNCLTRLVDTIVWHDLLTQLFDTTCWHNCYILLFNTLIWIASNPLVVYRGCTVYEKFR